MAGTLYLVPTPIGNLGDISQRAADTLEAVDFIAAEDTRVTVKLLNHLGIKKAYGRLSPTQQRYGGANPPEAVTGRGELRLGHRCRYSCHL